MTRNFANTHTGIWRDDDFIGLTSSAQRTYWMLKSQPDISAAGTLPLTVGRWAKKAKDTTPDSIWADIAELTAARFVYYDEATEELLVRTFVRWDNGYGNPKRRPVIIDAAAATESLQLRQALAREFQRLGLPIAGLVPNPPPVGPSGNRTDHDPDSHPDSLSGHLTDQASREHLVEPERSTSWDNNKSDAVPVGSAYSQVNNLSGSLSGRHPDTVTPSERVVVTQGPYYLPQPTTLKPQPPPPPPPDVAASAAVPPTTPTTEGEGEDPTQEQTLVAEIHAVRPEWSPRSITRALGYPEVTGRSWPIVAAAMRLIAADPESYSPGRIRGDGPWWTAAAAQQAKSPAPLEPPCGSCGPNRMVIRDDGRVGRCPACHPLRRAS